MGNKFEDTPSVSSVSYSLFILLKRYVSSNCNFSILLMVLCFLVSNIFLISSFSVPEMSNIIPFLGTLVILEKLFFSNQLSILSKSYRIVLLLTSKIELIFFIVVNLFCFSRYKSTLDFLISD